MQKLRKMACSTTCQLCSGQIWDEPVVKDVIIPKETIAEKSNLNRKRVYSPETTYVLSDRYCGLCFFDSQKLDKRQRQFKNYMKNQKESNKKDVMVADSQGDDMNMSIDLNESVGL